MSKIFLRVLFQTSIENDLNLMYVTVGIDKFLFVALELFVGYNKLT